MKRPLFIFTIYLFVFMGVLAMTGAIVDNSDINITSVAQVQNTSSLHNH